MGANYTLNKLSIGDVLELQLVLGLGAGNPVQLLKLGCCALPWAVGFISELKDVDVLPVGTHHAVCIFEIHGIQLHILPETTTCDFDCGSAFPQLQLQDVVLLGPDGQGQFCVVGGGIELIT